MSTTDTHETDVQDDPGDEQEQELYETTGPRLTRRGALKAGAAGAATVAGASMLPDRYSPVQEAQAIAPAVAAYGIATAGGLGAMAGVTYSYSNIQEKVDEVDDEYDDFVASVIYDNLRSIELNNIRTMERMLDRHGLDGSDAVVTGSGSDHYESEQDADETDYWRLVWDDIRAKTANGIVEEKTTGEIESDAYRRRDVRNTRLVVELVTAWNNAVSSIGPDLLEEVNRDPEIDEDHVIRIDTHSGTVDDRYPGISRDAFDDEYGDDEFEVVVKADDEDETVVAVRYTIEAPVNIDEIESYDEDDVAEMFDDVDGLDANEIPILSPVGETADGENSSIASPEFDEIIGFNSNVDNVRSQATVVGEDPTDDDRSDVGPVSAYLVNHIVERVAETTEKIGDTIPEYVEETVDQTDPGDVDDLLGPGDLIEDDGVSEGDALARQLIAQGITPSDATDMTIDHPDVGEATGMLFAEFDGYVTIREGESIPSEEIRQAVFVESGDDSDDGDGDELDELDTTVLDPSEDIEIVEIDREEYEIEVDDPVEFVDEDDEILLEAGVALDDIEDDQVVVVEYEDSDGDEHVMQISVGAWDEHSEDGETWVIGVPADEDIDTVTDASIDGAIVGDARYDTPPDPESGEDMAEAAEAIEQQREDLEAAIEALEEHGGDGWFGGGGGSLGGSGSLIAVAAAALGIGWLIRSN